METLKPCPFCGCSDIDFGRVIYPDGIYGWFIECCGCENAFDAIDSKESMIHRWNRRIRAATESAELHVNPAGMPG